MKDLRTTAEQLRNMADQLDGMAKALAMPVQHVNIPGAFAKLRAALGSDHLFSVRVEFDSYQVGEMKVQWTVYDGSEPHNYEATTLADAVNLCLASHQPLKEGDAEGSMSDVADALSEPIPM